MASVCGRVKLKWLEHLNTTWVSEGGETIASRDSLSDLYNRLLSNQEVIPVPQQILHLKGPPLPDFDHEPLSAEEQEHYLNSLLTSQLTLARATCSDSLFSTVLHKRMIVLSRIFYAIGSKYHEKDRRRYQQQAEDAVAHSEEGKTGMDKSRSGMDALIEMGVKTMMSLLFSLLKQNWMLIQHFPSRESSDLAVAREPPVVNLCNDVLQTALHVVGNLPPLSLASESKLPALGLDTLAQVTEFLKTITLPNSGADCLGKRLASELVLALAAQRGSLRYILEWIEMALVAAMGSARRNLDASVLIVERASPAQNDSDVITHTTFVDIILQMKKSAVSPTVSLA